jgi:deoxyribonuclease-4
MRIGAHVAPGGLAKAVGNAVAAGCESMQIFVSNPRGWAEPVADPAVDERFRQEAADAGVYPVFIHAPYLVNLASPNVAVAEHSASVTAYCLARGARIGAAGVVIHAGSDLGKGRPAALARTAAAVWRMLEAAPEGPDLLLEFTAGTRNALASRFEEMAELLAALGDHPRVKVCFDTCHAHAAGYDLSTFAGATAAVTELLATVGADRVLLVHANDSAVGAGACRDRHERIGTGTIGEDGFAAVLTHPDLRATAMITETSGDRDEQAADIATLKKLREATG